MLSVILYGRNDNHGYNYHKRLAISLNCIAEMLSDPDDEILFSDYNTSDELPTIIEAIQDTLTDRAKARLRIFRVRREQHQKFSRQTHLNLLEPIARNVALLRSNPVNKWILSTNSDMIFIPENRGESLTSIVSKLSDGFYTLPRFELPEYFWESSLERSNPRETLSFLREESKKLHLNTIVRTTGSIQFDNPGDFQLATRETLFQIRGFDERMLKGWHVDSNLCKRLSLIEKRGGSLEEQLMAFHCNHTQKESLLSHKMHPENDWNFFVDNPAMTAIHPVENWGLQNEKIEEIRLPILKSHLHAVSSALNHAIEQTYEFSIHRDSFNTLTYPSARIMVYLVDHLYNLPRTVNIAYFGFNRELLVLLTNYLETIQFAGKIYCPQNYVDGQFPFIEFLENSDKRFASASLYIFDFGFDENSKDGKSITSSREGYVSGRKKIKRVMRAFFNMMKQLKPGVKFIGINTTHTDFNTIFSRHLSIRLNSFATGISYGYLIPQSSYSAPIKKRAIFTTHYLIVRYLYNYSDKIRTLVSRTKISRHFKKFSMIHKE